uniref:Histone-like DNA-binding protein n=1 Tax=Vibrio sp. 23023 TaxID=452803 RepID=A9M4N2_9VIBR|nr:HU family DNA-binding protein [Vibrio sp. 23023]ABX77010.1 Histone-like DNA-binding protein [Vibrio sp. 23023]
MNKVELIARISSKYDLDEKRVRVLADVIFDEMAKALLDRESIEIPELGDFWIKTRPEKLSENRRGQVITIREKHAVRFKPVIQLRKALNPKSNFIAKR